MAELSSCTHRPIWIPEELPRQKDQICLPAPDDVISLFSGANQTNAPVGIPVS